MLSDIYSKKPVKITYNQYGIYIFKSFVHNIWLGPFNGIREWWSVWPYPKCPDKGPLEIVPYSLITSQWMISWYNSGQWLVAKNFYFIVKYFIDYTSRNL